MYKISIDDISKLRQITGSGIMNCKKALEQTKGNLNQAIKLLRTKGQEFIINKKKITNQGLVIAKVNHNRKKGVIIALNSETDFASRNKKFTNLINEIAELAIIYNCNSKEELMLKKFDYGLNVIEKITELAGIIKEKLVLTYEQLEAPFISYYTHQNRIAALVGFSEKIKNCEDIYKNVAMQVVAMNPIFLNEKTVDKSTIEKEIKEKLNEEKNNHNIIINNFFSEKVLTNQPFIKNNNISIIEYIKNINSNIEIINFKRVSI
ncbi:MAG: translation elongation factor Ts [Candidatus Bostrichicola ureolyticus]|nr:MAG: translation elongation factor Ts [Candidatus Bostrichicola ureolyticus]